ncbi:MAG: response regulator [Caulobacteraceae bacterium]
MTDDDPTHLELMREWLQPIGFELAFARDGAACLDLAEREPPDLVIMDISMPGIDGWEAARRLRAMHGDRLAILMVSANAHDFSRTRREDDPHDDFLTKPYEVNFLFERLPSCCWTWSGSPPPKPGRRHEPRRPDPDRRRRAGRAGHAGGRPSARPVSRPSRRRTASAPSPSWSRRGRAWWCWTP